MSVYDLVLPLLENSSDFGAGGLRVRGCAVAPAMPTTDIDWATIKSTFPDPQDQYYVLAGPGTSEWRIFEARSPQWDDKNNANNRPAAGKQTPNVSFNFTTQSNAGDSTETGVYTIHATGQATGGGGGGGTPPTGGAFADDPRGFRGANATSDYGTTPGTDFTILVDHAGSGDYTTFTAACAVAVPGDIIAAKEGTYYEAFSVPTGVELRRYGTDVVWLSGQQLLSTGTRCSAAQAGLLGAALGVNGSPVFRWTGLLKSDLPVSDLLSLNPFENGRPLSNAQDRPDKTELFFQENEITFHNPQAHGGGYTLSGTTVLGVVDPTVINATKYTNAELLAARVRYFGLGNETYLSNIATANVATNTITFSTTKAKDGSGAQWFAIQNAPKSMVPGTWCCVDNGSTYDFYVYPYDEADIDKVSIVKRTRIITIGAGTLAQVGNAHDIKIRGLNFSGSCGTSLFDGSAICDSSNTLFSYNILIEDNNFAGFETVNQLHYGAVWLAKANNVLIQNNSFDYCTGHGVYATGSGSTQDVCTIRLNAFRRCGSAAAKSYGQSRFAFMRNYVRDCGYRSHGNLVNTYISGQDEAFWGNEFVNCQGYITAQATSNFVIGFNWLPTEGKYQIPGTGLSNRKITNQGGSGVCYCFNNSAHGTVIGNAAKGHLAINWDNGGATIYYANNIGQGIQPPKGHVGTVAMMKSNLCTHNGFWKKGTSGPSGTLSAADFTGGTGNFDTSNRFNTVLSSIYADYANKNWAPKDASSDMLTMTTEPIGSFIDSYCRTVFASGPFGVPDGDWDRDAFGGTINYAALKMGADQSIHA